MPSRGILRQTIGRSNWQLLLVVGVVCALTVSLATRTFPLTIQQRLSVQSGSSQAMRQHMDRDAAGWVPPVPVFAVLQAPVFYVHVLPAGPPLPSVLFDEALYNRPPPSC